MCFTALLRGIVPPSCGVALGCLLLLAANLSLTSCIPSTYGRSAFGTEGGYSLDNADPRVVHLMVARKIERPLYIVLDSKLVKDTWPLETAACATGSMGCEQFKLMQVQTFVRRDLKEAMEHYFTRVNVIESRDALPDTPHVVGDVRIDDVRLNELVRGGLTHVLIEMTWAFAMRLSEAEDYSYSFAGTAASNDSYPTFEAGCATLVENAIPAMLKKWVEEGGMKAMLDTSL